MVGKYIIYGHVQLYFCYISIFKICTSFSCTMTNTFMQTSRHFRSSSKCKVSCQWTEFSVLQLLRKKDEGRYTLIKISDFPI